MARVTSCSIRDETHAILLEYSELVRIMRAAGFAKGGARVALADVEGGTELTYEVDAKVGGKLAQLGSRLIDGFAKKMADQFFERFQAEVEGTDLEADAPKKGWLKKLVG